jgi:hypothetical protein
VGIHGFHTVLFQFYFSWIGSFPFFSYFCLLRDVFCSAKWGLFCVYGT